MQCRITEEFSFFTTFCSACNIYSQIYSQITTFNHLSSFICRHGLGGGGGGRGYFCIVLSLYIFSFVLLGQSFLIALYA